MSQYLEVIELSSLDGTNGFKLTGEVAGDQFGFSVASAGDVNNDGFDDLIIGAKLGSPNGAKSGASYVIFGKATGWDVPTTLAGLDGNNGFQISGEAASDYAGQSVSSAGDVNGDGFDDLIIGAFGADPHGSYSGASYLVFGKASGFSATLELSALNGTNGFQINGVATDDISGMSVSSAGDFNGDGFADLLIGANGADPNGNFSGSSYVVFGGAANLGALDAADGASNGNIDLSSLAGLGGANGFKINGAQAYDQCGLAVSSAGDVNKDGFDDLIVGARGVPLGTSLGASYVVYGVASGLGATLELSAIDGGNGFQIAGKLNGDHSGCSVASAGDVNGDGFADLVVGAYGADPHGSFSGASYVVFGAKHPKATIKLAKLDGTNGFKITGDHAGDRSGWSVSSAGDFNGDGFDDLIVGAKWADPHATKAGASYVVFGAASGFGPALDPSSLDGNNGFRIRGEAINDYAGTSVSSAGDVNGDGFADIMVGAPDFGTGSPDAGSAYVIFGGPPAEAVARTGSAIDQTIYGGDFNDTLSGLGGKDTLVGGDGDDHLVGGSAGDVLDGGQGADVFVYWLVSDSTGRAYDVVQHAKFTTDQFDVTGAVGGIDTTIAAGTLSKGSFDSDLAAAVDAGHLAIGHAVLFTPDAGSLAGKTFLIVEQNGVAGYQAGADLVINLSAPQNLASIDTGDFI